MLADILKGLTAARPCRVPRIPPRKPEEEKDKQKEKQIDKLKETCYARLGDMNKALSTQDLSMHHCGGKAKLQLTGLGSRC